MQENKHFDLAMVQQPNNTQLNGHQLMINRFKSTMKEFIPHQVPMYMMQKLLTRPMLRYWNITKQSEALMRQSIDGIWMIYLLQLISTIVILFELVSHSIISDNDEGITIEYDEVDPESSIELQEYNFTLLDKAISVLHKNNKYPILELMGNPKYNNSYYWNDFDNRDQLYCWKDFISPIADRYLKKIYNSSYVYDWRFETWNEPPGWTENFKWTNTSWEKYFDACNEGLKQIDNNLRCGAPSGYESITLLYRTLNHVLNGTNYFDPNNTNNNNSKIRIDFISVHDKGNEDEITVIDEDLATESIISGNKYNTLLQRVNPRILLFNDEGDPKVGWSKHYEWRATTGYAAFILQGIELDLNKFKNSLTIGNNNNDLNNIAFGLISNDNCFMGDGTMQQRTVNTRFMINNSNSDSDSDSNSNNVQFEYVPKPPLHIMSLLSLHGDTLFVNFTNGNGDDYDKYVGIVPTLKEYVISSVMFKEYCIHLFSADADVNQRNENYVYNINLSLILDDDSSNSSNNMIAKWYLDYDNGNAYPIWQNYTKNVNSNVPDLTTLEEMRLHSYPTLNCCQISNSSDYISNDNEKNTGINAATINTNINITTPGTALVQVIIANATINNDVKKLLFPRTVSNLAMIQKSDDITLLPSGYCEYLIEWDYDTNDVPLLSHIVSRFNVYYFIENDNNGQVVNDNLSGMMLNGFSWITKCVTNGTIGVSVVDYFGNEGQISKVAIG